MVVALLGSLHLGAGVAVAKVLGTASGLVMCWVLVAASVHYATDTLAGFCVAVIPAVAWCIDLIGDRSRQIGGSGRLPEEPTISDVKWIRTRSIRFTFAQDCEPDLRSSAPSQSIPPPGRIGSPTAAHPPAVVRSCVAAERPEHCACSNPLQIHLEAATPLDG
jgi:hypothetical protein